MIVIFLYLGRSNNPVNYRGGGGGGGLMMPYAIVVDDGPRIAAMLGQGHMPGMFAGVAVFRNDGTS